MREAFREVIFQALGQAINQFKDPVEVRKSVQMHDTAVRQPSNKPLEVKSFVIIAHKWNFTDALVLVLRLKQ